MEYVLYKYHASLDSMVGVFIHVFFPFFFFLFRMREDNARVYENVGLMQQQKSFR